VRVDQKADYTCKANINTGPLGGIVKAEENVKSYDWREEEPEYSD
jgi:hypothetical protein